MQPARAIYPRVSLHVSNFGGRPIHGTFQGDISGIWDRVWEGEGDFTVLAFSGIVAACAQLWSRRDRLHSCRIPEGDANGMYLQSLNTLGLGTGLRIASGSELQPWQIWQILANSRIICQICQDLPNL